MAYKFQRGSAILSGALLQEGNVEVESGFELVIGNASMSEADLEQLDGITAGTVAASKAIVVDANKDFSGLRNATATGAITAGTSFIIGSADLNEADMELIDGLTAGTVAASKAVTVDSNKDTSGFRNVTAAGAITAGTSFIIGSADLNETDLEKLDGITDGTAAASKAVVLDSNKDISGLRNLSGVQGTFSSLTQGRLVTAGSSGLLEDQAALYYDDAREDGYLTLVVSSSASGSAVLGDGYLAIYDDADNTLFEVSKYDARDSESGMFVESDLAPAADAANADKLMFIDASDSGRVKVEAVEDLRDLYFSAVSGDATVAAGGALTIAADAVESGMLNDNVISGQTELAADGLAAADELLISDGGTLKKIGVDNLFLDGPGLLAEAAVTVADDYIMFLDGGATGDAKKESVADLAAAFAGTGLKAASGVLALDANELSQAAVASGDFFVFEDATDNSTKKESVDDLATLFAGTGLAAASAVLSLDLNELSAADVAVGADFIAIVDADDNSTKKESIADLVAAMAGAGLTAASGQLSVTGNYVHSKADGDTLQEGYNYFADISAANVGVDLPASPSVGDVIHVKAGNITGDYVLRISCQGSHLIDGEATIDLESPFAAVSLVYVATNAWRIV